MINELAITGTSFLIALFVSVMVNRYLPTKRIDTYAGVSQREITALKTQIMELLDTVEEIQKGKRERDWEIAQLTATIASVREENEQLRLENMALRTEVADLRQLYLKSKRGF